MTAYVLQLMLCDGNVLPSQLADILSHIVEKSEDDSSNHEDHEDNVDDNDIDVDDVG